MCIVYSNYVRKKEVEAECIFVLTLFAVRNSRSIYKEVIKVSTEEGAGQADGGQDKILPDIFL